MKKNDISEFELEREDFKIKLKRGPEEKIQVNYPEEMHKPHLLPSTGMQYSPESTQETVPPTQTSTDIEVKAPIVGTFYRAPSPDSAPYVELGSEVDQESVVCIIEAMKVMNEIKAEVKGVITQVLVENSSPVEYGQPLFKVRPS
ncbi:MAG: acetyl-CoA carboxylase biotin carboxyl carrier protein [Verrucomicrobia bacterium]|nr:acetyl-CoA carboxylase biotin carboxyl carrier protein [Verrucomicrobiota bacterium]MCF7708623.1 acetyl-CoA carboxylase biotin carboxyl carrier protein [Verrucomicrobiota bacterium]